MVIALNEGGVRRSAPSGRRAPRPARPALALLAVLALLLATGAGALAQTLARAGSPAEGHAQVIAQGVATMPRVEVGWRVVAMDAQPLDDAPVTERSLGFILAADGAVLVTDEASGARTLLNPGEAMLTQQGAYQQRASLDDDPAGYYALELVVAADLENEATIGSGDLLFAAAPFDAPAGDRDLDLVRDTLAEGEEGEIDADAPVLILVTAGEVSFESDDDEVALDAGEAAVLSGEIAIESDDGGTYVAAVIGDRAPAQRDDDVAGGQPPATQPPVGQPPAADGAIVLVAESCPPGTILEEIQVTPCDQTPTGFSVTLTGAGLAAPLTEADSRAGDAVYWPNLPFGTYTITFTALPDGHDVYYVFGSGNAGASAHFLGDGTGFTFTLDAALAAADPYYNDAGTILLHAIFVDSVDDVSSGEGEGPSDDWAGEPPAGDDLDSDGDGLYDVDEIEIYGTDPTSWDSDGDGVDDWTELDYGTDPLDPGDYPLG